MSRIPPAVIAEVDDRRQGTCEATGFRVPHVQYHHRQARAMGGSKRVLDVATNLLGLCPKHHAWAHAHPAQSRLLGLIVPSWADYTEVPVLTDPTVGRC